jgi:hypothetical protein
MKKMTLFLFGMLLCVPAYATAQEVVAGAVHCDAGEVQVCTKPTPDGNFLVMFDEKARPMYDCSVSTDAGVDLRCVPETYVCEKAHEKCDELVGDWRWSERRCRCYQHVDRPRDDGGSGNGGGGNGGSTNVTVVVQTCDSSDFAELDEEMDRIERDLPVVAELHPLQLRATEVYSRLLECDDGSAEATRLIGRAAQLIANFEPERSPAPHDYTNDLERIRETIAGLNDRPVVVEVQPAQNWCTDTHAGRWWCIAFPILLGIGAAIAIPVVYDYLDDGSADGIINW